MRVFLREYRGAVKSALLFSFDIMILSPALFLAVLILVPIEGKRERDMDNIIKSSIAIGGAAASFLFGRIGLRVPELIKRAVEDNKNRLIL
ncbi:UNVERIFIED_CONTAM: hypothetical protein ABID98_001368 [Brevibacillus sp. OAP136]